MVLSKKGEPMNPRLFEYAKGLHDFIKEKYKATVVWVLRDSGLVIIFMSKERKEHCITITGGFMVKAVHPLLGIAIFVYSGGGFNPPTLASGLLILYRL